MKIVFSKEGIQYKVGRRVLCDVDPVTLTPTWLQATPEERNVAAWDIESLIPGEVLSNGMVLGPVKDFKFEVKLHAAGNPDRQQYADIGPRKTVRVTDLETAAKVVMKYQSLFEMGVGNCARDHGKIYCLTTKALVGQVNYGGKIQ
jgi:hypothetical protein